MKEQIEAIYNSIKLLLESELPEYTEYLISKSDYDIEPRQLRKSLGSLMNYSRDIYELETIKYRIDLAEQEAAKYHKPKIFVEKYHGDIHVVYYETDQEVYDRLNRVYITLIDGIKRRKETEHKKYLELKTKYEK